MSNGSTPKRRGCLFYGCIVSLILLVLLLIGVGTAAFFGYRAMKNLAVQYTDTTPMTLPKVQAPPAEVTRLQKQFDAFTAGAKSGKTVPPLVLTGDQVNALINNSPGLAQMKDRVHVAIDGDRVKGQVSIPLDNFGMPGLKGRYLNGAGVFKVTLGNGVLDVRAESLEVKGAPLPEPFMAELRKINLAEKAANNPDVTATLRLLESLQVKDGAVTIQARAPAPAPAAAPGSRGKQ